MLDLNFVRENLPLVEEKLRQRGMNPAEILQDFADVDTRRRHAITEVETIKARRNRASEEIAKLKKTGQDATALLAETKDMREKIQSGEKTAGDLEQKLQQILAGIPNLPHTSVPVGKTADDNVEVRRWGAPPKFDFAPKPHWELGEQLGILDLERAVKLTGRAFRGLLGFGSKAGAGARQLHARSAHARAWLHRSVAALPGEFRVDVRHRAAAQVCCRFVSGFDRKIRKGPLPHPSPRRSSLQGRFEPRF